MKVLIIKLTSMGDLMHALPALTDAAQAYPEIEFDWVVDQAFAEVPLWHINVKKVIKTAHRQWRKTPLKFIVGNGLKDFRAQLNLANYDAIVDLQGNIKSAVVGKLRRGEVSGFDAETCREKPAHWAYKYQFSIPVVQHSIERQRQLMAQALDYPLPTTTPDYGVNFNDFLLPELPFSLPDKFMMFVHNASWETKLWPVSHWKALVDIATAQGVSVLLPCGNDAEYARAQEIATASPLAHALPKLSLDAMAAIMSRATAAVCSDTGLAHLAAVANIPAITLYGPTDIALIGTHGEGQQQLESDFDCAPCYQRKCSHADSAAGEPVCMAAWQPKAVWDAISC